MTRKVFSLLVLLAMLPQSSFANCEHEMDEEYHCCGYLFDAYPPTYFSTSTHSLASVSALGDSLELEDGSFWQISRYDGYKALSWRSTDPLIITQNHRWFSNYQYRIINQNTGSSLEVNLFAAPPQYGDHTISVSTIDLLHGILTLTDPKEGLTEWSISSGDVAALQSWALNDVLIIGHNSGWDSDSESILINMKTHDCVRAKKTP